MKIDIIDRSLLQQLNIRHVYGYLQTKGWQQRGRNDIGVTSWSYVTDEDEKFSLILPPNNDFEDFAERIREFINIQSDIENKSQLDIYNAIARFDSDVIRIKGMVSDSEPGIIPLKSGINFYNYAYRTLLAAACSAVSPQAIYVDKPDLAERYVEETAQMAQSEQGSFIIVILSPINIDSDTESASFNRNVVQTLTIGLSSLARTTQHIMSQDQSDFRSFEQIIEDGVSANLCDALTRASSSLENNDLVYSVDWSGILQPDSNVPNHIVFTKNMMPIISDVANYLSEIDIDKEYVVEGYVTNVAVSQRGLDTVIISEGRNSSLPDVKMKVRKRERNVALQAIRDAKKIRCIGDLVKRSKPYLLQNIKEFEILN